MVTNKKTILGVFAHPDDESMGPGATFAKYAAAGHRVAFATATDGGAGRLFDKRPQDNYELRKLRRQETTAAAQTLGIEFLGFMGLQDGVLERVNVLDIELEIVRIIRKVKPDVLVTFHGSGISHHPDHRVMALALIGAFLGSGRVGWYKSALIDALPPHQPSKLYYYTIMRSMIDRIDWPRDVYASPDDEISTIIDTRDTADIRWKAIKDHKSQGGGPPFEVLYEAGIFEREAFVRIFPTWVKGSAIESDLLDGLDE
ncbi:MAG: PIG-L family deacetylase [Candidatus Latescibacterota bacterium]|nr:MAG: PIG-L family deacetylase [Candidatus Latescibacterota bacterium]